MMLILIVYKITISNELMNNVMITSLPHFMFMTFIKRMISSIKENEWNQKQNKVKSINFYMLMISTELKKFKLSVKPRNLNKFHNLALIKKRITYVKQE